MADDRSPSKPERSEDDGLTSVLGQITQRLKSQPLVFGLSIAILLVIAASLAVETLRALTLPLVVIFVVALAAWLIVELRRTSPASKSTESRDADVQVRARNVGTKGVVSGIEGLPAEKGAPSKISVDAEGIEGRVTGASYRPDRGK